MPRRLPAIPVFLLVVAGTAGVATVVVAPPGCARGPCRHLGPGAGPPQGGACRARGGSWIPQRSGARTCGLPRRRAPLGPGRLVLVRRERVQCRLAHGPSPGGCPPDGIRVCEHRSRPVLRWHHGAGRATGRARGRNSRNTRAHERKSASHLSHEDVVRHGRP